MAPYVPVLLLFVNQKRCSLIGTVPELTHIKNLAAPTRKKEKLPTVKRSCSVIFSLMIMIENKTFYHIEI
jgi:hypothetical protein